MTHPLSTVQEVLSLRACGLGARRIARETNLPVKTVQDWIRDPVKALARREKHGTNGRICDGSCEVWKEVPAQQYAYLLGQYLGDGHIVRVQRSLRLSIYSDQKYPGIIEEASLAIEIVRGTTPNVIPRDGCVAITSYWNHWPCVFPQFGPGMKHEREIVLADWQRDLVERHPRPFIRGLIHSDGCRGTNVAMRKRGEKIEKRWYPRYQFSNKSADIRGIFCSALDRVGVHWTQMNKWTISVARRGDVVFLDSFIGPKF